MLLNHGANADAVNDKGENALHVVSRDVFDSQEQGVVIVRLLLQRGLDVHAKNNNHNTPLHTAAFNGMLEIARVLIDHGANSNVKNKHGRTPLHQVARGKYVEGWRGIAIAQLLLERGAEVYALDKDRKTASELATLFERFAIADKIDDY